MDAEKYFLTAFVDESGSITRNDIKHHNYFIVAVIFTRDSRRIRRYFQKGIASLLKSDKYKKIMDENGEIKGSEVTETKKNQIYDRIVRNCKDDFELGIIVLDNKNTTKEMMKNHSNTFNYIIQEYLDKCFRKYSRYRDTVTDMHFIIDEQNVAKEAEYNLGGYLNQHFTVYDPICNHFDVMYSDSKDHALIQMADFISNTFYRNIEKHDRTSDENVKTLSGNICNNVYHIFENSKKIVQK